MTKTDKQALRREIHRKRELPSVQGSMDADMLETLLDELEAAEKRIAELEASHTQVIHARDHYKRVASEGIQSLSEARTLTVKLPPRVDGSNVPFTAHAWNCCLDEIEKRLAAAGIALDTGE